MNVKDSVAGLPSTFQKIIVHTLSNDFTKATEIKTEAFEKLTNSLLPHQVIVRYRYFGINASDINFTAGRYDPTLKPPFDAGFEAMGQIVVTGKSTSINLLQPVCVMTYGAFAEYQVLSEKAVIPVPALERQFLGIFLTGLTADLGLEFHGHMKSNETVMVTAAAGGAGMIAVQLAKLAGNHVIGTCSTGKEDFLRSIGCDRVINYKTEDVAQVLKQEYPKGVDIVFESVGGKMFETCMKALAVRGRMIIIGAVSTYASDVKPGMAMNKFNWDKFQTNTLIGKSLTVTGFFLNHYTKEWSRSMKKLSQMVLQGKLKPRIHHEKFVGLPGVYEGIACMHSGKNIGKVVIDMNHSSRL